MHKVVLIRHGESEWNKENKFTGWTDVDLSTKGVEEARRGGKSLKEAGFLFDVAYTSVLKRAVRTLNFVLDELDLQWIPVRKEWRLNERHYGALTGLNKAETARRHGDEQFRAWRRSYDIPPPPLASGGPYDLSRDRRYAGVAVPATETLKTTLERVRPYWETQIAPAVAAGERVLVVAHGNSLRAIVKLLFDVSDRAIPGVEIPTGNPMLVELDASLRPVTSRYLDASRAEKIPAAA